MTHDWTLDDHICWEKNCDVLYHGDVDESAHEQMVVHMREAHNIAMPEKCAGQDCPQTLPF